MKGRPLGKSAPQRQKLTELRMMFEGTWTAEDRRWAEIQDTCLCDAPTHGPRYLGTTRCLRCSRQIRGVA